MKRILRYLFRIKISYLLLATLVTFFPSLFEGFRWVKTSHSQSILQAESLWRDKDPYSYPKLVSPGSVVKVVLKSSLKIEYESEYKATFDNDIKTVPDKKLISDLPSFTTNNTYMRSKVGKSKTNGKVLGTMAVLVTSIDPGSGNLELEGSKTYSYGEERINLRLSGTISPGDLDKNRNISSDNVANL